MALRLGLTSFGGPVAHIAYFREEYVVQRAWLDEARFGELMTLSQFIPGPGSSQLGAAIGYERAGFLGGFAAWLGFTLPSALVMGLVALGIEKVSLGAIHGMKLAAIAVVALAWIEMSQKLTDSWSKRGIAFLSLLILTMFTAPWMTLFVIGAAAVSGVLFLPIGDGQNVETFGEKNRQESGGLVWLCLVLFFAILGASYLSDLSSDWLALSGIYQAGSLVFGGGHVVLPMLQEAMVPSFMAEDIFLGGYGATQAVPGPVFTFAAFLGVRAEVFSHFFLGGLAAIVAVFLPGMLLLGATLGVWGRLRTKKWAQKAILGANAAVVGVLGLALIQMVTGGAVGDLFDASMVAFLFLFLRKKLMPAWAVVLLSAGLGTWFL